MGSSSPLTGDDSTAVVSSPASCSTSASTSTSSLSFLTRPPRPLPLVPARVAGVLRTLLGVEAADEAPPFFGVAVDSMPSLRLTCPKRTYNVLIIRREYKSFERGGKQTLATSAFLKFCSWATASQSMSALLRVCLTMAKKNMASEAVGSRLCLGASSAMVVFSFPRRCFSKGLMLINNAK